MDEVRNAERQFSDERGVRPTRLRVGYQTYALLMRDIEREMGMPAREGPLFELYGMVVSVSDTPFEIAPEVPA